MPVTEYICEVKASKNLTPTVFELTFTTDKSLHFEAGQYISIVIPGAGANGKDLRRAYSIASPPEKLPIELCIKTVEEGPGTTYLNRLRPGDKFRGFAPYGHFVYKTKPDKRVFFISTGTGIAPFRSMILSEAFKSSLPKSTACLFGVREESELLYLEDLSNHPGVQWIPAIPRPTGNWNGFKGRVTDYLRTLGQEFPWSETEFYLCGGGDMIDETKSILFDKGVSKEAIHREIYYKS